MMRPIPPSPPEDWASVPPPEDCGEALVDPTRLSPRVAYGAAYLEQGLPGRANCLLRETVANKLALVAESLPQGYSVLIYDSLRPLILQRAIYEQFRARFLLERPDISEKELAALLDDFVALPVKRPERPAPHTTGGAVDLTLCKDGLPLDMGTGFDDLTGLAHTRALEENCPPGLEEARENRRLLYHRMTAAGFVNYPCEWWHYAYGERQWAAVTGEAPFYGFCPECDD